MYVWCSKINIYWVDINTHSKTNNRSGHVFFRWSIFAECSFVKPCCRYLAKSHIIFYNLIIKSYNTLRERIQLTNCEIARFKASVIYDLWAKILSAKIQQMIIIHNMDFSATTFTFLVVVTSIMVFMKANVSANHINAIQMSDGCHN